MKKVISIIFVIISIIRKPLLKNKRKQGGNNKKNRKTGKGKQNLESPGKTGRVDRSAPKTLFASMKDNFRLHNVVSMQNFNKAFSFLKTSQNFFLWHI